MKKIDVTIDGIPYHAINVLRKQDNRLIIRTGAASGQTFRVDSQGIHHISFQNGEEWVSVRGIRQSSGNNTKIQEIEFLVVDE